MNQKFQHKVLLEMSEEKYTGVKNILINFSTGCFVTSSIYIWSGNKWNNIYKLKKQEKFG